MHCTVKSWNELLSANTNKLKSSNSLCHRAKPKHGNWIMNFPCDNRRTSRATRRRHMVIRDPVPEAQFRDEEADTPIVLHARHARRNHNVDAVIQDEMEKKLTSVWASK